MGDYGFHDNISSYECGAYVSFDLCYNVSGDCSHGNGSTGAGHVRTSKAGSNDNIDRVYLRSYDASSIGAVTMFANYDCKGDSGRFISPEDPAQTNWYNKSDMEYLNVGSDRISSVMIP